MNPWPPSSSSSSFHPSSAAPSSPGCQPHHPPPPPPPPVASSSSSHHHHHPYVPPPKVLNADDISDIKAVFPDLRIAAPNVCRWINPPLRGIDDSAEIASTLEMRQQHPGQPCGRILACGTILKDHVIAHINSLKGIRVDRRQKSKQKTYECLWSGCQALRFTSRETLSRHATEAHVQAHRPCPFLMPLHLNSPSHP
ncbi:hypothetical protein BDY24DRAFT_131997 [Mrakia frigida]|uniref:uncharacterized protein n=1 Tax=Mrakia frigida TaxID=29902 RepID=UPI003FCC1608